MIHWENKYLAFIKEQGVGAKDKVGSSPDSYIQYLKKTSEILGKDVRPSLLQDEDDWKAFVSELKAAGVNLKTADNYGSALWQYVKFVRANNLK